MKTKLLFFFFFASVFSGFSQKKDTTVTELISLADERMTNENFEEAVLLYRRILVFEPENADVAFKVGFCYLNSCGERKKSIPFFEKSVALQQSKKKSSSYFEAFFYLATAYRVNYEFQRAIDSFKVLKTRTDSKELTKKIEEAIEKCKIGLAMHSKPLDISITSLGETINSKFSEHSPLLTANEQILIFTSRRPFWEKDSALVDGQYDENIFISYDTTETPNNWTIPKGISSNINTKEHEAAIGLSSDGTQLLIYKPEDEGTIYISTLQGENWSKPKKLNGNINTKYRETHASFSPDGKKLFFVSDRKGSFGGLDVYVSELSKNGDWAEAKNLGQAINTSFDEESPFLHIDGTLYFASKGHNGMGSFDIFQSKINEFGTWAKAENIGHPINTTEDDIFLLPTIDSQRFYFASQREGGMGKSDLYKISVNKKQEKENNFTVFTGKVTAVKGNLPPIQIFISEKKSTEKQTVVPNLKTGKFVLILQRNKTYQLNFETANKQFYSDELTVAPDAPNQMLYKMVKFDPDAAMIASTQKTDEPKNVIKTTQNPNVDEDGNVYDLCIKIGTPLFGTGESEGMILSVVGYTELVSYLRENPEAKIEIGAYADATGEAKLNRELSQKRAETVRDYFLRKDIPESQLSVVAYGEENPIALNTSEEGKKLNRRIEIRMIKQGAKTLLIRFSTQIPEHLKNKNYNRKYLKNAIDIEAN